MSVNRNVTVPPGSPCDMDEPYSATAHLVSRSCLPDRTARVRECP